MLTFAKCSPSYPLNYNYLDRWMQMANVVDVGEAVQMGKCQWKISLRYTAICICICICNEFCKRFAFFVFFSGKFSYNQRRKEKG